MYLYAKRFDNMKLQPYEQNIHLVLHQYLTFVFFGLFY